MAQTLWLNGNSRWCVKVLIAAVWLPFILVAGCPVGQCRKNVLAAGGVCVLIHLVNAN
jgi:hypothetical protein